MINIKNALLIMLFALLFLSGCGSVESLPDKISTYPSNQFFMKPNDFSQVFSVKVESKQMPGLFGGTGSRRVLENVDVEFSIVDNQNAWINSKGIKNTVVSTNIEGKSSVRVYSENYIGEIIVMARVAGAENNLKTFFYIYSGLEIYGNRQETYSGKPFENPFGVRFFDEYGNHKSGIRVSFKSPDKNIKIFPQTVLTDSEGFALASVTAGDKQGKITVSVLADYPSRYFPPVDINSNVLNNRAMLILLFGGMAIFMFGMKMMSDGLQHIAGNRLKSILNFLTRNRVIAIVTGAVATAVIQSSSACIVMVVGFMNAGLLGLRQAMATIMGANIGTTITGQIIAFKISELAYPAVITGLLLLFLFRGKKPASWGEFIFGFGLLFLGMTTMSDSLKPLRDSELFRGIFAMFDCTPVQGIMPITSVLGAILIGAVLTAVVQSSSATIGLTMALASSGLINFYTAFPLILGDNIGTTITAVLATIPANKMAKIAGLFHTIFNLTGALIMTLLLYVTVSGKPVFLYYIDKITPGSVFGEEASNIERHIAMAHSFFNVSMAVILLPFLSYLEKIVKIIIPVKDDEIKISYLEENLLSTPELALEQAKKELLYMVNVALKNVFRAYNDLTGINENKKEKVERKEELIDNLQYEISEYIVKISKKHLLDDQASRIPPMLHCINDAERIGDLAGKIERTKEDKNKSGIEFNPSEIEIMNKIKEKLADSYSNIKKAFDGDMNSIRRILKNEEDINRMVMEAVNSNTRSCVGDECDDFRASILFVKVVSTFERIGDHLVNIAERVDRF